ncbi:MAG: flagellar basal-body rod protein FlgF [Burkholderiaceae bacterium]|nr:flagellar basal-body rod protein FlgF [Burkholderiaceae bacterium]
MDRMIYTSLAGAKAAMQRQDVMANNLANSTTNGFKAELAAFRSVPIQGSGASTRAFSIETTTGYDAAPGAIEQTGRNLDVAVKGNSWLAVQSLDGTEAYTRAGSLQVSPEGLLVTQNGLPVVSDGGPITIPQGTEIQIGSDGTVTGTANEKSSPLARIKMVTPDSAMTRGTDGLFRSAQGDLPADPSAQLMDGALEGSNVSPVSTMVSMIAAARQFEQQMKLLQTAESQSQAAAKLLGT